MSAPCHKILGQCDTSYIVLLTFLVSNCPILFELCQIVLFAVMVSNCPILFGWCQIVLGVELSQMIVLAIHCVELLPEYLFRLAI